jgi:hypothetical protein
LQDSSGSAEDQLREAEHYSSLGEGPSGHKTEFAKDPSRHEKEFTKDLPKVPRRRWTMKSHYVAAPLVPTNPESQPIIKPVGER